MAVSYCSQPYYTAIRPLVSISDYGSLRTVEAERRGVSRAGHRVGSMPWLDLFGEKFSYRGAQGKTLFEYRQSAFEDFTVACYFGYGTIRVWILATVKQIVSHCPNETKDVSLFRLARP